MSSDRVLSLWLLALLVLHFLPIWIFGYFPTQDGPIHLSNAKVFLEYDNPECSLLPEYYQLNNPGGPNWFAHLTLAGLLESFSPRIAEKLFLSFYLLAFMGSAYFAILGISRKNSFLLLLVIPFLLNHLVFLGFYNFIFGIPLFFLTLGIVLRSGPVLSLRSVLLLVVTSVAAFFVHPLTMLANWFMAVPVLVSKALLVGAQPADRGKARPGRTMKVLAGRLVPIWLAVIPSAGLFMDYWLSRSGGLTVHAPFARLLRNAGGLGSIVSHSRWEVLPSLLVSVCFLTIGIHVLRKSPLGGKRTTAVGLFVAILAMFVLYFVAPSSAGGGNWINARLLLYPFLAGVLWFACFPFSQREKIVLTWLLSVPTLALLGLHLRSVSALSSELEQSLICGSEIAPNSTLLPVSLSRHGRDGGGAAISWKAASLGHFAGYLAAEQCLVEFDNYAAWKADFPLAWRSRLSPRRDLLPGGFEGDHPVVNIRDYEESSGGRVDYVLLRDLRTEDLEFSETEILLDEVLAGYEEICSSGSPADTHLYRRTR